MNEKLKPNAIEPSKKPSNVPEKLIIRDNDMEELPKKPLLTSKKMFRKEARANKMVRLLYFVEMVQNKIIDVDELVGIKFID